MRLGVVILLANTCEIIVSCLMVGFVGFWFTVVRCLVRWLSSFGVACLLVGLRVAWLVLVLIAC